MRRTRSNSFADPAQSTKGRRSLRNTQDPEGEKLYEIPTKFRSRMPHPEPKAGDVGKLSPMRRSMRLSGGLEILELSSRTRKRRLQCISTPDKNGQEINVLANGTKSHKVENFQQIGNQNTASIPPLLANGICSRTRRRFDSTNSSKDDSDSQRRPIPISCSQKNSSPTTVMNSPLKQARFSARHSKLSPTNHHTNGGPRDLDTEQAKKAGSNLSNAKRSSLNRRTKQFLENSDATDFQNLSSCECKNDCQSYNPEESDLKCKLCGKHRAIKRGKNGSVLNGPIDGITLVTHNLRRSGRATSLSSSSSTTYTSLPIAVEEATDKNAQTTFDTNASDPALKKNQNLSQGHSSSPNKHNDPKFSSSNAENVKNESVQEKEPTEQSLQSSCPSTEINQADTTSLQEAQPCNHNPNAQETEPAQVQNDVLQGKDEEKRTVNGFDSDIMGEFSCVDLDLLNDEEGCVSYNRKKRKMNLRSSGVRCDPDFYTLSLDLMIKRPRLKSGIYKFQNDAKAAIEEQGKKATEHDQVTGEESMPTQTEGEDVDAGKLSDDVTEQAQLVTRPSEENPRVVEESTETNSSDAIAVIPSSPFTSTPTRTPLHKVQPRKMKHPKGLTDAKLKKSLNNKMVWQDSDEPPPLFTEDPPHGPDVYYFESDHVALKHNVDYHNLLRAVSLLESQRHRCLNDIKVFEAKKSEAILEPIEFVKKFQSKEPLAFPCQQNVPDLPDIEWSKYSSVYGTFGHVFSRELLSSPKQPVTRKVKINFETGVPLQPSSSSKDKSRIQGPRSQTFRASWTVEEQRKLEDLLVKYPCEENESNRYRKVAEELGSRTAMQVQSRVQKYFIKLAKAGLPVPGTMPKLERSRGRTRTRARPHPHHHLTKLSTFFPTFHCPVKMQDDDPCNPVSNDDEEEEEWGMGQDQVSDEEDVPEEMRYSDEYLDILRLKRIRREQLRVFNKDGQQALAQHVGYECDMCNSDPIQGVRYHCIDCPSEEGVDLCQSCIRWQDHFETENHKESHRMEPVYKEENFVDDDYQKFASRSGEYNYLDPNFFPPKT